MLFSPANDRMKEMIQENYNRSCYFNLNAEAFFY